MTSPTNKEKSEAEHINAELHKEFDKIFAERKPKYNIGMPDLKFLEVPFLKPTTKNPKAQG